MEIVRYIKTCCFISFRCEQRTSDSIHYVWAISEMLRGRQCITGLFIVVGVFFVYMFRLHRQVFPTINGCEVNYRQVYNRDNIYVVIKNYRKPWLEFSSFESITYATHADLTFIENLVEIVDRWKGPVSVALYAPGTDFHLTDFAVQYAQHCLSPLISQYVTFHLFYHRDHPPPLFNTSGTLDCNEPPPWQGVNRTNLYRIKTGLLYPVNVARNIARETATTYYVLSSDIELYPSEGIISSFLDMVSSKTPYLKVFPLPVFEMYEKETIPRTKESMVQLVNGNEAISFHDKVCRHCHRIPELKAWLDMPPRSRMGVHYITRREGDFENWEPFYIGTHCEPLYDERLSWEGEKDKMIQAYEMCIMGYEFCVLSDAFLIHKPGIKKEKVHSKERKKQIEDTNSMIHNTIIPELKEKYGSLSGMFCNI